MFISFFKKIEMHFFGYFMHVDVLPTRMFTTTINTASVHGGQKRALNVRELELQTPASHVGF